MKKSKSLFTVIGIISMIAISALAFSACGDLPPGLFFVKGNNYEFALYDSTRTVDDDRFVEILNQMGFENEGEYNVWIGNIKKQYKNYVIQFNDDGTFVYFQKQNEQMQAVTGIYIQDQYEIHCYKSESDEYPILYFRIWNGRVGLVLHEYWDDNGTLEFMCFAVFSD